MIKKIRPAARLRGAIIPPADKSISQRAAIFGLLHDGISVIKNYSTAQDPQQALECVERLGAEIKREGTTVTVTGTGRDGLKSPAGEIYCGNSGTAMRLLAGVLAGAGTEAALTGDDSLSSRTMTRIINPLREMGAVIEARQGSIAPLQFKTGGSLVPIEFELPVASAQLKSCVLLAGLFGTSPTKVIEKIPSRDHTERLLNLPREERDGEIIISASLADSVPAQSYTVPGDFSSTAFWLAAGVIHPDAEIHIKRTGINPTRKAFLDILIQMGADISLENEGSEGAEPVADVTVRSSVLQAVRVEPSVIPNCIDELPVLAIAMAFAKGTSVISGAAELRHKETDRLMAVAALLKAAGADFEEKEDGFIIHGKPELFFESAVFESFHDHRIAMAAAVLALRGTKESEIKDAECAAISYPAFWDDLEALSE